mgnify:CR=1 FL=1
MEFFEFKIALFILSRLYYREYWGPHQDWKILHIRKIEHLFGNRKYVYIYSDEWKMTIDGWLNKIEKPVYFPNEKTYPYAENLSVLWKILFGKLFESIWKFFNCIPPPIHHRFATALQIIVWRTEGHSSFLQLNSSEFDYNHGHLSFKNIEGINIISCPFCEVKLPH